MLQVFRQFAGFVGFKVLAPLGRGVVGFQFGDGGLEGGEVLKGGFEAADDLLALVEDGLHVGDAVDAGHSLRFC